jgi:hypothetical protein
LYQVRGLASFRQRMGLEDMSKKYLMLMLRD